MLIKNIFKKNIFFYINLTSQHLIPSSLSPGVLEEDYVEASLKDEYYSDLTDDMKNQWKADKGKTVKESLSDYLVEYMGKPMNQLLR